jgi:hypothetical protein
MGRYFARVELHREWACITLSGDEGPLAVKLRVSFTPEY